MPRDRDEPPAVRVYTVCDESRYLIVRNVPALGCGEELSKLFGSYGEIEECKPMDAEDAETFTDVFWIKFIKVGNARFAKRKLDEFVFYGNRLQVSYAPQFESLADTKEKLEGRREEVLHRIRWKSEEPKPQFSTASSRRIPKHSQMGFSNEPINSPNVPVECGTMRHVSSNNDYFSSPSMNKMVTLVREKLDKIANNSRLSDSSQPSQLMRPDKRKRI